MTTQPRFRLRSAVLASLALAAALGLNGCSGAAAATPDDVFKEYVSALNSGDIRGALGLIADPGEITVENSLRLEELGSLPEPKLSSELDLDEKIEATTAYFNFGQDKPYAVAFIKNDGKWQLEEPLFFEESRAEMARTSTLEMAQTQADGRSESTWWEVIDELGITAELPSGEEFLFPRYLAGVAPGEHNPIPLVLSDLPDWEYLQKTPFASAELSIVNNGGRNQGYTVNPKLAADPLRSDIAEAVGAALRGQKTTYSAGGGFMRDGTEYAVEILDAADGCGSGLHKVHGAPDLRTREWRLVVSCDISYSDSQFPGVVKKNQIGVYVDRTGAIDEDSLRLETGPRFWG